MGVWRGRMQIQDQIPIRLSRGSMKSLQTVFPRGGKRLEKDVTHSQLIARVLEGYDVMSIARNALGVFAHGKHVLAQVKHRDVLMMGMFGEQIQDAFVVAPFIHQIIQDQNPSASSSSTGKPLRQCIGLGNPFVKTDPTLLHAPKTILPGSVTVMHGHGRVGVIEQLGIVQHQFFGEHGFATTEGSHDQDTGRGLKTEGFSQHDDDSQSANDCRPTTGQAFLLTTTLVIRGLTHLVPPQLITNQLFDSSSRFMIITDIIVIGKVIQKFLQRTSTGFGFQVQQGIIAATVAVDGLKGFAVGGQVLPMANDPLSQGGRLLIRFQGQGITVHHFALVAMGPESQPMFPGSVVGVGVDDVGLRVGLEGGLGQTVTRHGLVEVGSQDRIVSGQIIQLHIV